MPLDLIVEQVFENLQHKQSPLPKAEYEECRFINCNFSSAHLSTYIFSDCEFIDCDLSLARFKDSSLKSVRFKGCKMSGIDFAECNDFLFAIHPQQCLLNYSSFYGKKLPATHFDDCSLREVNFEQADLSRARFDHCNLQGAHFEHSILEGCDFRTAEQLALDPALNRMKKARFRQDQLEGLLSRYQLVVD